MKNYVATVSYNGARFHEEEIRQNRGIELICSENYPSRQVREDMASILTAKYAEGYPGHRYYGGCEYIDAVEELARKRCCALFHDFLEEASFKISARPSGLDANWLNSTFGTSRFALF